MSGKACPDVNELPNTLDPCCLMEIAGTNSSPTAGYQEAIDMVRAVMLT